MKNLWILTEERPKLDVLKIIIERFLTDNHIGFFSNPLRIIPFIEKEHFQFCYQVLGIDTPKIGKIIIKTVSGYSSFVDFLVYFQKEEPTPRDTPIYAIEETKTDDSESRNTGIYQRCTKFVYIDYFYPNVKKIMLYSLQITQKEKPTQTNIFGSRMLATLGVEVIGKTQNSEQIKPFHNIKELIEYKNNMKRPPKNNIPILITETAHKITISGRLYKSNSLAHDPNIGALSIICACLRKLGWKGNLEIIQHGLSQKHLTAGNKFIRIANKLHIRLSGLNCPNSELTETYWKYDLTGEKLGTIFIHLVVENFTNGYSIFENHAGCEKSYFKNADGKTYIPLEKYSNRVAYKAGDKTQIAYIPDLILLDMDRLEIINIEGKKYENKNSGILEINNYDFIENHYIKPQYPDYNIIRTVVLYGGTQEEITEIQVGFLLNQQGKIILGIKAPRLFGEAIRNLLDYWKK